MTYVDYDECGVVEIRCMNCGTPVAKRTYKTLVIKSIPPREEKVLAVRWLSNRRKKKYILEDGSYMEAIVCSDCVDMDIDPKKIEKSVEDGWVKTWEHENKEQKEIEKLKKKSKIRIK